MNTKRILALTVLLVAFIVVPTYMSLTTHPVHATGGQAYYVDSHDGSNSNSGKDTAHPWLDFTNVTGATFNAGDSINLEEGDTWSDTAAPQSEFLHPLGSGSLGNPIVITAYAGDQGSTIPLVNGKGDTQAIKLDNQEYWTISNIEIQNNPGCTWATSYPENPSGNCNAVRRGIYVHASNAGSSAVTLSGITITGMTIDNVYGGTGGTDTSRDTGGIIFVIDQGTSSSKWDTVTVTNNTIYDVNRNGIWFFSWYKTCVGPGGASGSTCSTPNSYPCDLPVQGTSWVPSTNIKVGDASNGNTIHDIGGNGIGIGQSSGQTISTNTVYNGAADGTHAVGIWTTDSYGSVIKFNIVHDMKEWDTGREGQDSEPFDSDYCNIKATIEYNWSYNNQGGFLLQVDDSGYTVVRYNISERDGYGGHESGSPNYNRYSFMFSVVNSSSSGFSIGKKNRIYNNDFYMDDSPSGTPGTGLVQPESLTYSTSDQPIYQNNVIENKGTGSNTSCAVPNGSSLTLWTINYNGFWGGSSTSLCNTTAPNPQTNGGFYTDPKFTSPGDGHSATTLAGVITDYTLGTGSPALCEGQFVSGEGNDGGRDFAGNSLPSSGTNLDAGALEDTQGNCS